jgi:predicted Rossmann fold nucleotide-binding protein DprA/Smf involved in DNA uptake
VLKAIDEGDSSIDALAVRTSMGVREVTGALAELEIENLVVRSGPGLFIRAP